VALWKRKLPINLQVTDVKIGGQPHIMYMNKNMKIRRIIRGVGISPPGRERALGGEHDHKCGWLRGYGRGHKQRLAVAVHLQVREKDVHIWVKRLST
jgi:hypothetical protein